MFKIIFFDLDGTLLTEEKKILAENKEAIKKVQEKGIEVAICSGRQKNKVREFQEDAGSGRYVISSNGAEIYDTKNNEQLFNCQIEAELCEELYNFANQRDMFFRIDTQYGRYMNQEKRIDGIVFEGSPLNQFFHNEQILQISMGAEQIEKMEELMEYLKNFPDIKVENRYVLNLPTGKLNVVNIINQSASKGNAISGLCKYLKINLDEAIAFGNDANDCSMLKIVGYPIAMKNSTAEVKALAKEVITVNDEPGIAEVLEKLIFEN